MKVRTNAKINPRGRYKTRATRPKPACGNLNGEKTYANLKHNDIEYHQLDTKLQKQIAK